MSLDHTFQVPTVAVHMDIFQRVTRSVTRVNGMPRMRQVYVPQPVMGKPAELRAYIDGPDLTTGRPVMQEVIEGLNTPGRRRPRASASTAPLRAWWSRPARPICSSSSWTGNWTDKLPIVLPTEARVEEMLRHTSHRPDEVVGHMRPTGFREYWEYSVEKAAVNAVMAGCARVLSGGAGPYASGASARAQPPPPPPPWPWSTAPCGTRSG